MASEAKLVSILIHLDYSKAFDSVNHELLCSKLSHQYGFPTFAVNIMRSYLSNRTQFVSTDGSKSLFLPVISGVVQELVLGPLLFLLFINDITPISSCKYHKYADGVLLYINCQPCDITSCIRKIKT
jgi:hypothetical protein